MPKLTTDCDRVIILGLTSSHAASFDALDHIKVGQMILEIRISEDYCRSDIYIVDLSRFTLGHMAQFTFPLIEKYFLCAFVSTIYIYNNNNNNNNNNTYLMVQSLSWEGKWFAASQEVLRIFMELEGSFPLSQASATCPWHGPSNPVHITTNHLLEIHPNIIHPSTPTSPQWSLPHWFPHQEPIRPLSSPILPIWQPISFFRFYHPQNFESGVEIIQLLIMQSPPLSRYLDPPRSKYTSQHHILKHPQIPFRLTEINKLWNVASLWLYAANYHNTFKQPQTLYILMLKLVSCRQLLSWFHGNVYLCNNIAYSDVQLQADQCADNHHNFAQFCVSTLQPLLRAQRESVAW